MKQSRQHYNKKFKEETVKYVQQAQKSLPELVEELNINVGTLRNWMGRYRQFQDEPFVGSGHLREADRLLQEKDEQIRDLEEEIAILKKAMHFFSKDRK